MQNAIKIIATSALLVSALPVFSQNAPAADPRNVVQLSASGAVEVQQDELILTLGASADGRDASSVQAQLRQVLLGFADTPAGAEFMRRSGHIGYREPSTEELRSLDDAAEELARALDAAP